MICDFLIFDLSEQLNEKICESAAYFLATDSQIFWNYTFKSKIKKLQIITSPPSPRL